MKYLFIHVTTLALLILSLTLASGSVCWAQVVPAPIDGERATLHTDMAIGSNIGISFTPYDGSVWVDINGNGICDRGECRSQPGVTSISVFPLKQQSVTIYGPVKRILFGGLELTSLEVEHMPRLAELQCFNNKIETIDLSGSRDLQIFFCFQNKISSIDLSGCPAINDIRCFANQIGESQMNRLVQSLPERSKKNRGFLIALDTTDPSEGNVCTVDAVRIALDKNWDVNDFYGDKTSWTGKPYKGSPTALKRLIGETPRVYFDARLQSLVLMGAAGASFALYTTTGDLMTYGTVDTDSQHQIDMTSYPSGSYILQLDGESYKIYRD